MLALVALQVLRIEGQVAWLRHTVAVLRLSGAERLTERYLLAKA